MTQKNVGTVGGPKRRNISVRSVRRPRPDTQRLSRALMAFALQQAADEAAAEAEERRRTENPGA